MMKCQKIFTLVLLLIGSILQCAIAQSFPNKAITIVVPYSAGGVTDQLAREIGVRLAEIVKQPVVVDNKAGGGGVIALNAVKAAPADGHMIFIGDFGPLVLNPILFPGRVDISRDFRAVTRLINAPSLVVVSPNSPYHSVDELLKAASKTPPMSYASPGVGSGGHLFGEMVSKQVGVKLTHVPYRGSGAGLIDVSADMVKFMADAIVTSGPQVKGERVRALAITSDRRSPLFPQVPTLKELGHSSIASVSWFGAMVKTGTPEPIIERLNSALRAAITDAVVAKKFTDQGVEIVTSTPAEFSSFIQAETTRWTKVITEADIKPE